MFSIASSRYVTRVNSFGNTFLLELNPGSVWDCHLVDVFKDFKEVDGFKVSEYHDFAIILFVFVTFLKIKI